MTERNRIESTLIRATHSILEDFKALGVHLEGCHSLHYLLQQDVKLVIVTLDQQLKQRWEERHVTIKPYSVLL